MLLLNIVWTRTHINQNSTNLYEKNGNSNQKEPLTYYSLVWFFASPVQFHAFQFWRKRTLWDLNEQSWQLFSAKLFFLCLMIISGKGSNRQHSWKSDFCHSKLISKFLNISKLVKTFFLFLPHQYFSDFFKIKIWFFKIKIPIFWANFPKNSILLPIFSIFPISFPKKNARTWFPLFPIYDRKDCGSLL